VAAADAPCWAAAAAFGRGPTTTPPSSARLALSAERAERACASAASSAVAKQPRLRFCPADHAWYDLFRSILYTLLVRVRVRVRVRVMRVRVRVRVRDRVHAPVARLGLGRGDQLEAFIVRRAPRLVRMRLGLG